ncbi:hypothetical protein ACQU0X_23915 [Pseudovibrio ascidiaceicola]|uniref:hypothetical protein n=1 Tax=Pseudovibrio ascidiaceicola TaxID=285279 RepID=UPI003D3642B9
MRAELELLHKVAVSASNYELAQRNPEFEGQNGGSEKLAGTLRSALNDWQNATTDKDCRNSPV